MLWNVLIDYRGVKGRFRVEDCDYGMDWGRTRAIAVFFNTLPDLIEDPEKNYCAKNLAAWSLENGLIITMAPSIDQPAAA